MRVIAGRPVVGQHYDVLAHRHTVRALPRLGCTAEESGRGPDRWWTNGDLWIGLAAWVGVIFICIEIIRNIIP